MTEADGGCQRLLDVARGHQYVGLKIFQERFHFSGSQAAQLSHLSHLVKKRLILSRFRKKTLEDKINKNAIVQNNFISHSKLHYVADIYLQHPTSLHPGYTKNFQIRGHLRS